MLDTYHSDYSSDSFSSLKLFRESIERYHGIRISKTIKPSKPTRQMILGNALHCMILESDIFEFKYVCEPDRPARSNADKAWWFDFEEKCKHAGTTLVHPEDWKKLPRMKESIERNPMAFELMFKLPGVNEEPIYWTDLDSEVALKIRPDRFLESGLIVDLKTSDGDIDPDGWSRKIDRFNYHQQAALYMEGSQAMEFAWAVVDTNEPFETAVHRCGPKSLALGYAEIHETIRELGQRQRSGDWSGRYSKGYSTVELPPWRLRKNS